MNEMILFIIIQKQIYVQNGDFVENLVLVENTEVLGMV